MRRLRLIIVLGLAVCLSSSATAWACSVCMGNRDSALVKGAESGVLAMVLITYAVLLGFVGVSMAWFVKARRIRAAAGPRETP